VKKTYNRGPNREVKALINLSRKMRDYPFSVKEQILEGAGMGITFGCVAAIIWLIINMLRTGTL